MCLVKDDEIQKRVINSFMTTNKKIFYKVVRFYDNNLVSDYNKKPYNIGMIKSNRRFPVHNYHDDCQINNYERGIHVFLTALDAEKALKIYNDYDIENNYTLLEVECEHENFIAAGAVVLASNNYCNSLDCAVFMSVNVTQEAYTKAFKEGLKNHVR